MRNKISKYSILLLPLFISPIALAEFEEGYFQLRGGAGIGWLSAGDGQLGISQYETDTVELDEGDGVVSTLGIGYVFPLGCEDCYEDVQWFPKVIASIDAAYQFETDFYGDVLMYGDPNFDNYTHHTEIENLNAMFNLTLSLAEYRRWSVFVLGGLGAAWTWVDYSDEAKAGIPPDSRIELDTETTTNFAFQGGAGISFEVMPELDITLTYLYTDLGDVNTSDSLAHRDADDGDISISAAEFDLHQQSLVFGLMWNFI